MMETKQTAIGQLIEDIKIGTLSDHIDGVEYFSKDVILELLESAKQKEQEQIKQAHIEGFGDAYDWPHKRNADEYWQQTYGGIVLSPNDAKIFADGITNPPEPNERLLKAVEEYKKKTND